MNKRRRSFLSYVVLVLTVAWLGLFPSSLIADVYVRGYTRSNGTYVAPHYRSDPNRTKNDNFSTKGNINPYTGKPGTKRGDNPGTSGSGNSGDPNPGSDGTGAGVASDRVILWGKVSPKMTKEQVTRVLGTPNVSTSSKWIYTDGGRITFNDEGLVSSVSPGK